MAHEEEDQFWKELRANFIEQPRHERSLEQAAALARAPGARRARQPPVPSQYGKSARFEGGPATANPQTQGLIQISVPIECAKTWVVSLSTPSFLQIAAGGGSIQNTITQGRSFAQVRWGMGGANHVAEIDWSRGRSFLLNGSFVQVDAVAAFAGAQSLGLAPLVLSASVTPFEGAGFPNVAPPQRSVYVGVIQPAATSPIFRIPAYAVSVQVIFNGANDDTFSVLFQREQGVVQSNSWKYSGSSERVRPNRSEWAIIPGDAATFQIENTKAVLTEVVAVFQLALA